MDDGPIAPTASPEPPYQQRLGAARSRSYWVVIAVLRALRLRWRVDVDGAANVAPGAAILVGNHVSSPDPLVVVMSTWWRVTAFTKLEWFQSRLAPFFRLMGQIPLRCGDAAATDWALDLAALTLADGGRVERAGPGREAGALTGRRRADRCPLLG